MKRGEGCETCQEVRTREPVLDSVFFLLAKLAQASGVHMCLPTERVNATKCMRLQLLGWNRFLEKQAPSNQEGKKKGWLEGAGGI